MNLTVPKTRTVEQSDGEDLMILVWFV